MHKFQIDTNGSESFQAVVAFYLRTVDAVFIVYDLTNRASFDSIQNNWFNFVKQYAPNESRIVLVGNKSDLRGTHECVSIKEGQVHRINNSFQNIEYHVISVNFCSL